MNNKWIPWDYRLYLREYSIVFYNADIVKIFGDGNLCNGDHIRNKHACSMLVNLKKHWNEKQSLLVKIGRIPDHILKELLYCKELEDMENRDRPPIVRSLFHNHSAFDKCFSSDTREIFRYLEYDYIVHELNDNVYKRALIWENPDGDDGIYYQDYSFPRPVEESPYIVPILTKEFRKGFRKLEAIDKFEFDNNDGESVSAVPASAPADNDSPADNKTAKPETARKRKNCRITIEIGLKALERRRKKERQADIASDLGFHYTQFQKNIILRAVEKLVKQEKNENKDWQTLALAAGMIDDTTDIDNETFSDVPISQKPYRK